MNRLLYIASEDTFGEWIRRLIWVRWIMSIGTAFIVILANFLLADTLPLLYLLITIVALICFNIIISIYNYRIRANKLANNNYSFLIHFQVLFDLLFLTMLLHFLGGLETYFFFFYLIYIVIACFIFSKSISFVYVFIANAMYIAILILEWQEIIPHYNLSDFRSPLRFQQPIHIFTTIFTLLGTSLLTAHIVLNMVSKLLEREQDLIEMNSACELKTRELIEANTACELKTKELADANFSCELKTKELAELNEKLKKLDEARTQFIWAVTHELRAPSAAIQSYLKLIQEGYIPQEKVIDVIKKAERQAIRQMELIGDLLQLARLEEPDAENKAEPVNVIQILEEVSEPMRMLAQEKGLTLYFQIDYEIPPAKATSEHVKMLLTNLISNAIKYTDEGGSIWVSLAHNFDNIIGTVQDTGIGIDKECLPNIFDQFYRAKNAKSMNRQGTGLGLSIVKRILETYGGTISVDSEPSKGTKFTFTLPKAIQ